MLPLALSAIASIFVPPRSIPIRKAGFRIWFLKTPSKFNSAIVINEFELQLENLEERSISLLAELRSQFYDSTFIRYHHHFLSHPHLPALIVTSISDDLRLRRNRACQ